MAAFVGIPTVALWRTGFRLVPRFGTRDPAVRRVVRLSAWAVFQHSMIGVLLLAAIVVGNTVEGGTLAYQVAWVFFLAPYAVLAQPVHTAILPDLARQAGDPDLFASSLRWALDSMAVLIVPVAAALVAFALPIMRVAAFGQATRSGGVGLLAAGLASLAIGLYTYSAFLLFARAYYALGDSKTPAVVALGSAVVGIAVMALGGALTTGRTTVAFIGFGHSLAYGFGALILWLGLARRTGHLVVPRSLIRSIVVVAPLAFGMWLAMRSFGATSRLGTLGELVGMTILAGIIYVLALRKLGGIPSLHPRPPEVEPAA